jgi:hypothetical protein
MIFRNSSTLVIQDIWLELVDMLLSDLVHYLFHQAVSTSDGDFGGPACHLHLLQGYQVGLRRLKVAKVKVFRNLIESLEVCAVGS